MIISTTPSIEGRKITQYHGVVIDLDIETVGGQGAMLMVSVSGTAVTIQ